MGGLASFIQTGLQLGTRLAAQRNAIDSQRQQADAAEAASRQQASRLRDDYARTRTRTAERQRAAQSLARARAAKRGATGESATAVLAAQAARDQRELGDLYHQTALRTGDQSIAAGQRAATLRRRAREQEWQYQQNLWASLGQMAATGLPTLRGGGQ